MPREMTTQASRSTPLRPRLARVATQTHVPCNTRQNRCGQRLQSRRKVGNGKLKAMIFQLFIFVAPQAHRSRPDSDAAVRCNV